MRKYIWRFYWTQQRVQALRVARHRDHHHCVSNAGRRGEGTPSGKAAGTKYLRCDATYNRIARNTCTNCVRSQTRIVREKERERETAEGGLANCQGKEGGWGAGGWSWRRKRYGGFCPKIPVPNVIFADFCVLWPGSCGNWRQGA